MLHGERDLEFPMSDRFLTDLTAADLDAEPVGARLVECFPALPEHPDAYTLTKQADGMWNYDDGSGFSSEDTLFAFNFGDVPYRLVAPVLGEA